jgi:predicted GIY-YIG superfamily endonuclease
LVGISDEMAKSEALKLEYRIKRLPADVKLFELTMIKKRGQANNDC